MITKAVLVWWKNKEANEKKHAWAKCTEGDNPSNASQRQEKAFY